MASNRSKRVLILRNNLLMNAGMQSILSKQEELEVIGIQINNDGELFQNIARFKPDVVVLDEDYLTADPVILSKLLQNYPERRVVLMSLHENEIQVYITKKFHIRQIGELLAAI